MNLTRLTLFLRRLGITIVVRPIGYDPDYPSADRGEIFIVRNSTARRWYNEWRKSNGR